MIVLDYLENLLTENLGDPLKSEDELRYNCPFCDDGRNKHKLYVSTDKRVWNCFNCGRSGYITSLIANIYDVDYKEANNIANSLGISTLSISPESEISDEEKLLVYVKNTTTNEDVAINEYKELKPAPFITGYKSLKDNYMLPEAKPFLKYINKRGFNSNDIVKHGIGYVTEGYFRKPNSDIVTVNNSLVFLTYGLDGNYIYWNTRSIEPNPYVKSINAPIYDGCYSKKTAIFNFNSAIKEKNIVITEGVPDAITLGNSGVGTFGKQVTSEQIKLIIDNVSKDQNIYVMLDMDAKPYIERLGRKLSNYHKNTYMVINPTGKDANSLGRDKAWEIINANSVKVDDYGIIKLKLS